MRNLRIAIIAIIVVARLWVNPAHAGEESTAPGTSARLRISGFVDLVHAYNFNRPADHANFIPGTGTSAKRYNGLEINLAEIDFVMKPAPVGFHLAAGFGTSIDVVHGAEPTGVATSPETWRNLVRASIQYQRAAGAGLAVEAGVYPSHIGFEAFQTKDNWN